MTLGEHLDELRARLIRCVVALLVGGTVCFYFIREITGALTDSLYTVMLRHGYAPDMTYGGVAEPFLANFQLALILGFILTAPYILWQLWGFVAAGLYRHERKWVRRFVPISIGLFFAGTVFFLVVVTPLFLDFFIGYQPDLPSVPISVDLLGNSHPVETQPAAWPAEVTVRLPHFSRDPKNAPDGAVWINESVKEMRTRLGSETYALAQLKKADVHRLTPMIRIQEYLVFVLQMAAAFGLGFQVPVVVALIATIGIASSRDMARVRKYVWFGIAVAAAIITPSPDVTSMMLLFVPMVLLYEAGLLAARLIERERGDTPTTT